MESKLRTLALSSCDLKKTKTKKRFKHLKPRPLGKAATPPTTPFGAPHGPGGEPPQQARYRQTRFVNISSSSNSSRGGTGHTRHNDPLHRPRGLGVPMITDRSPPPLRCSSKPWGRGNPVRGLDNGHGQERGTSPRLSRLGPNGAPPPPLSARAYRGVSRHPVAAGTPRPAPLAPRRAAAPLRRAGRRLHALPGVTRLRSGRRRAPSAPRTRRRRRSVPPPSRSAPPPRRRRGSVLTLFTARTMCVYIYICTP